MRGRAAVLIACVATLLVAACGGSDGPLVLTPVTPPPLPTMSKTTILNSPLHFSETMEHDPVEAAPAGGAEPAGGASGAGNAGGAAAAPAPVVASSGSEVDNAPGCVSTCSADATSPLPHVDELQIADRVRRVLGAARQCLQRVGGDKIRPAVLLRFTVAGAMTNVRFDLGGYEDLGCAKELPRQVPRLAASRGTTVRCELRCDLPPAPPPAKRVPIKLAPR
jgi:hypothetical protein